MAWEYTGFQLPFTAASTNTPAPIIDAAASLSQMNTLGALNWELVTIVQIGGTAGGIRATYAVFKRQV